MTRPLPTGAMAAPYFDQFLGAWAMVPDAFNILADQLLAMDVAQHLQNRSSDDGRTTRRPGEYYYATTSQGIATVPIFGMMTKQQTSLSGMFGGTSTVLARRDIRDAANDPAIRSILIHIESGGGVAAGTAELFDDIRAASFKKTVWAYIEDLGASAAYWAAAGASRIVANRSAKVGSIGTYGAVIDTSKRDESRGIMTHVVRAGEFKGAGMPGTPITPEQLAEMQRNIDSINDIFVSGIATGRKIAIAKARELADGRLHIASEAMELGLIDGIEPIEDTRAALLARSPVAIPATQPKIDSAPAVIRNETLSQLVAFDMRANGRSRDEAFAKMSADHPDLRANHDRAVRIEELASRPSSVKVPAKEPEPGKQSATDLWNQAVAKHKANGKSYAQAAKIAHRENPGLHQRYLDETHGR